MTATIITMGIQKGGCSKTTTTGILAYLLAKDGYRVLVCDMDSQGNSTEMFTNEPSNETQERSILEAIYDRDPRPYIQSIMNNLDLLGSNNLLVTLVDYFYTGYTWDQRNLGKPDRMTKPKLLAETLEKVKNDYDFILLDTPPALSMETLNSLYASDYVVVLYECSKFCYSAVPNFMETVELAINAGNDKLKVAGIIRTLNDARRTDMKDFAELIEEDYPDLVFPQIIRRSAAVGRLSANGFEDNPELNQALTQHKEIYKELLERVGKNQNVY